MAFVTTEIKLKNKIKIQAGFKSKQMLRRLFVAEMYRLSCGDKYRADDRLHLCVCYDLYCQHGLHR